MIANSYPRLKLPSQNKCVLTVFLLDFAGPVVKSCAEVTKYGRSDSGFYFLHMGSPKLLTVYCDLSSSDGPWTVIQRRVYNKQPSDYQSKTWDNYRNGFGESEPNFWLGNKYIHELTKTSQRLKIILYTDDFNVYEAIYEDFTVGDEASKFVINFGAYSGKNVVDNLMSLVYRGHYSDMTK